MGMFWPGSLPWDNRTERWKRDSPSSTWKENLSSSEQSLTRMLCLLPFSKINKDAETSRKTMHISLDQMYAWAILTTILCLNYILDVSTWTSLQELEKIKGSRIYNL